ncbi:MAG: hypothetical protein FJ278_10395, partial [Planctomycetes bacterium]|nr:hypothetical protein [Planctomycetota bacterium]
AGKDGHVKADGERFTVGGQRIKFWGTNVCFGGCFPTHEEAEKIARRMAKFGINIVRFHHMDSARAPHGIWDPKPKEIQRLDAGQLDRLDYFIAQLKANGIYTNLNLHVSRKFTESDGFPDAAKLPKMDKTVTLFEPRMRELQKNYARDLLTHLNPYAKSRYVDEPCLAMVEITNENSFFAGGQDLDILPPHYARQLDTLWQNWLGKRYGTTDALRKAWDAGSEPLGPNFMRNGDFSASIKKEDWSLQTVSAAEASIAPDDAGPAPGKKSAKISIVKLSDQSWHVQVHQIGHTVREGQRYAVRFWAKADATRPMSVTVMKDTSPWTNLGLSANLTVGTAWQQYTLSLKATETQEGHARVSFAVGQALGNVWLADVSWHTGGVFGLGDDENLAQGTLRRPRQVTSFTEARLLDYTQFLYDVERDYFADMRRFLKQEMGVKALVTGTIGYGLAGGKIQAEMDFVDGHSYWEHPHFPRKPWDSTDWTIPNTAMVNSPSGGTLPRLAMHRVAGKPFTVTEYNHPAPNDYQTEAFLLVAAYGALQDWDGIFSFTYHSGAGKWDRDLVSSYFDVDSNPVKMAHMPACAALFLRGDVQPARQRTVLELDHDAVMRNASRRVRDIGSAFRERGTHPTAALQRRLALAFRETRFLRENGFLAPPTPSPPIGSDTGELVWDAGNPKAGLVTVRTAHAVVAVGYVGGKKLELGAVTLEMPAKAEKPVPMVGTGFWGGFAAISVVAMDGQPLSESNRILVTATGRTENPGMVWNETRTSVSNQWGAGPVHVEGIPAKLAIATKQVLRAFGLDVRGARKADLPVQRSADGCSVGIGPEHATLWYELATEH